MARWFIVAMIALIGLGFYSSSAVLADEPIVGVSSVIDGDTIEIHGQRIRLFGIDAGENGQSCIRNGEPYRCGKEAAFALADKIGRRTVHCDPRDTDRYGRMVAVCSVGGLDLNGWMVREGLAVAYRKYSVAYVADEEKARAKHRGLWAGHFEWPWDYRHKKHRKGASKRWRATEKVLPMAQTAPVAKPEISTPSTSSSLSDGEIARILIAQSRTGYHGSCPCPESRNRAGRRCGRRSAYSKPSGAAPLCYSSDVTPTMIAEYRKTAGR